MGVKDVFAVSQPHSRYRSSPKAPIGSAPRFGRSKPHVEDGSSANHSGPKEFGASDMRRQSSPSFTFGRGLRSDAKEVALHRHSNGSYACVSTNDACLYACIRWTRLQLEQCSVIRLFTMVSHLGFRPIPGFHANIIYDMPLL